MKITISLLILLPILFLIPSMLVTQGQQQAEWLTYENPDFGVSMQYPANWTKQEDNLVYNAIAFFNAPFEDNSVFVNLKVVPVEEDETFDSIEKQVTNQSTSDNTSRIINSSRTTLTGLPAVEVTAYIFGQSNMFTELLGSQPTTNKGQMVWTLDSENDILYGIGYIAPPSKFGEYLPIARQMINSFQIAK